MAAKSGNKKLIELLMKIGADVNVKVCNHLNWINFNSVTDYFYRKEKVDGQSSIGQYVMKR